MNQLKHCPASPTRSSLSDVARERRIRLLRALAICLCALPCSNASGQVQEAVPLQAMAAPQQYRPAQVDFVHESNRSLSSPQDVVNANGVGEGGQAYGAGEVSNHEPPATPLSHLALIEQEAVEPSVVTASATTSFTPRQFALGAVQRQQVAKEMTKAVGDGVASDTAQAQYAVADKKTPLPPPSSSQSASRAVTTSPLHSFVSMATSLMVVVGLFLGIAWGYRKLSKASPTGALPPEAFSVLGKVSVAPKQQLILVQFGPKVVLMSLNQGEARPISEIDDEQEVDRFRELCGQRGGSFRKQGLGGKDNAKPVLSFPVNPLPNEERSSKAASPKRREAEMRSYHAIRGQGASL